MIDGFVHFRKRVCAVFIVGPLFLFGGCNVDPSSSINGPKINLGKPVPVAMLIPKTYQNTVSLADSLEKAARMAVGDLQSVAIDLRVYDTAGSPAIAAQVAQIAVD